MRPVAAGQIGKKKCVLTTSFELRVRDLSWSCFKNCTIFVTHYLQSFIDHKNINSAFEFLASVKTTVLLLCRF
jgi:hypothetical protein